MKILDYTIEFVGPSHFAGLNVPHDADERDKVAQHVFYQRMEQLQERAFFFDNNYPAAVVARRGRIIQLNQQGAEVFACRLVVVAVALFMLAALVKAQFR